MIGFECEFVEQPPKNLQSKCPICLQLTLPITTFSFVTAVDFKTIQRLFETKIRKMLKVFFVTCRTWLLFSFDLLDASFTESLPTAGDLVRIT